jgi:hypothetical protein
MIEKYDLSYLNLNSIKKNILLSNSTSHGLVTKGISSYNIGIPILLQPKLLGLNKIIKQYIQLYCKQYNIPPLKIINSWFNISQSGNKLKSHNHPESIISGAFYVHAGKNTVPLIFTNTHIKPHSGLLIIFSSDLVHYTEEEQEQRIVVSFNTDYEESTRYTGH